jgi:prefoldin alpha subunit
VRGTIDDVEKVLIDIGTGYFVEKSPEHSKEYLQKRLATIGASLENVGGALQGKKRETDMVQNMLQSKMMRAQELQAADDAKQNSTVQ